MTTFIESRYFLSNIASINKEDYYNQNFVFDVYLLLTRNLNPFSLERKLAVKTKHEMIYMLQKECMPLVHLYLQGKKFPLLEWKKCPAAKSS